jgi:hypothetical protein
MIQHLGVSILSGKYHIFTHILPYFRNLRKFSPSGAKKDNKNLLVAQKKTIKTTKGQKIQKFPLLGQKRQKFFPSETIC